jgi:hypothetical protein
MRTLLVVILAVLPVLNATAQTKQDIRGFFPGMSVDELSKSLRTVSRGGCSNSHEQMQAGIVLCRVSDGNLILYLTQHVTPPVLKGLRFSFSSTTPFSRMIEHISGEYGLAAEHRDLGSGHAIWKLSKDKVLELSYRGEYVLDLTSHSLTAIDIEASVNPAPKF